MYILNRTEFELNIGIIPFILIAFTSCTIGHSVDLRNFQSRVFLLSSFLLPLVVCRWCTSYSIVNSFPKYIATIVHLRDNDCSDRPTVERNAWLMPNRRHIRTKDQETKNQPHCDGDRLEQAVDYDYGILHWLESLLCYWNWARRESVDKYHRVQNFDSLSPLSIPDLAHPFSWIQYRERMDPKLFPTVSVLDRESNKVDYRTLEMIDELSKRKQKIDHFTRFHLI